MPVSARSSVVFPWSMWPAVPMTMVIARAAERARDRLAKPGVVARIHGPEVEPDGPVVDSGDDRRVGCPEPGRQRRGATPAEDEPDGRQRLAGQRTATDS